jgi:molybdenum cofactor guanylyltransferase
VSELVVGILIGGRGARLGGVAKGLLTAPESGSTLIERLLLELTSALPEAPIALLGQTAAYAALGLPTLPDNPTGVGPLGGIVSLLELAEQSGARFALSLTCDLPRIDRALLLRLANEEPAAAALVTTQSGVRNPLVARYAVSQALPAARQVVLSGKRSVQAVLDALASGVHALSLSSDEERKLADWDVPEDLPQ